MGISSNRTKSRNTTNEDGDTASKMVAPFFVGGCLSVCGATHFLRNDTDTPSVDPTSKLRTKPSSFDAILTLQSSRATGKINYHTHTFGFFLHMWHKRCSEKLQAESLPGETRNTQRKILFFLSLGVYVNPAMMANHEKKVGCTNDSLLIFFKKGLSHSCQFLQFVWLIFRQINAVHCFYRGVFQTQIQAQIDTSPAMFPSSDVC